MYSVTVEAGFNATHRTRAPDGTIEPLHGHDWTIRLCIARVDLDDQGMVVDFERAQRALLSVVEPLHHTNLSEIPALGGMSPTAEVMARYVHDRLRAWGLDAIRRVEVVEAPGCMAAYEPPPGDAGPD